MVYNESNDIARWQVSATQKGGSSLCQKSVMLSWRCAAIARPWAFMQTSVRVSLVRALSCIHTWSPCCIVFAAHYSPTIAYAAACRTAEKTNETSLIVHVVKFAQGKPDVASMACAAGHCSGENPVWLTYAITAAATLRSVSRVSVRCARLGWPPRQLVSARKSISYRIVSYRHRLVVTRDLDLWPNRFPRLMVNITFLS